MLSYRKQPSAKNCAFSEFMRNASDSERERVFMKAIADQRKIIEYSEELRRGLIRRESGDAEVVV